VFLQLAIAQQRECIGGPGRDATRCRVDQEIADVAVQREAASNDTPELTSEAAPKEHVRGSLLLITADGTFGFSSHEDPFLQKGAASLHSILSKQPPEELHLLWGHGLSK
jgi:hypothetical protein